MVLIFTGSQFILVQKMNKNIYLKEWLELKPYTRQTPTDIYYLKVCNKVKRVLMKKLNARPMPNFLDEPAIHLLSCFLTSYFEDLLSETNIWNSFIRIHKRLYNKPLPFYDVVDYYEGEINAEDLRFLIWYFLNTYQEEVFISPFEGNIALLGDFVYQVLDDEWDHAPANDYLKTFYQIDEKGTDYYDARQLIDTLLFKTYLFYPDTALKQKIKILDILESDVKDENVLSYINDLRDQTIFKTRTILLSLAGKEWIAEILGETHPLKEDYLHISNRIQGYFFYKGQDDETIFLEHIASGKKFNLTKKSFNQSDTLVDIDAILFLGIAQWQGEWWFSGVFFQQPFDADLILDEKNSLPSRAAVNFLDHNEETIQQLQQQMEVFKEYNDGSPIAFMPASHVDSFIKQYFDFFYSRLKLSSKDIEAARERARKEAYFGEKEERSPFSEMNESAIVFFNPKSGLEIGSNISSAFPDPRNPFYKEEDSEEDCFLLLEHEHISKELAMYCIDNYKDQLSFYTEGLGELYLMDIDFLLRFWKGAKYHSKPEITYTGKTQV